jgi:hypothetical protein
MSLLPHNSSNASYDRDVVQQVLSMSAEGNADVSETAGLGFPV